MVRPGKERLSGTIEVDETYVGGEEPGQRGRGAFGKVLVIVGAEVKGNRMGRIRLRQVADASAVSLETAVKEMVEPASLVRTDGWRGYGALKEKGYRRKVTRDEGNLGENLLPRVNRVEALFKRWMLGTHQGRISSSYLDYYTQRVHKL